MKAIRRFVMFVMFCFVACNDHGGGNGGDGESEDSQYEDGTGNLIVSGGAQKGPYQPGSRVECQTLDASGYPTGNNYTTTTTELGMFTLSLPAGVYSCNATGFYWKEDEGKYSGAPTIMWAFLEVTSGGLNSGFINPRTNFVAKRALALYKSGVPAAQAITQAEGEINDMGFAIPPPAGLPLSTEMNLLGGDTPANREIFRVDCALMYASQLLAADPSERDAQLQALLNRGALEVEANGAFSADFKATIAQAERIMNPYVCTYYLGKYVENNGLSVTLPDILKVVDVDGNGTPDGDEPYPGMQRIPAGPFWMGCNEAIDTNCQDDEKPYHEVTLSEFFIDRYEVTVIDYKACVDAGTCSVPSIPAEDKSCNWDVANREFHPINCVTWDQANTYCNWAGKRLPTEAEWEKAARGTDGRIYPWGNTPAPSCDNVTAQPDPSLCRLWNTAPVGIHPSGDSPYSVKDMLGNVSEWVNDWYASDYYLTSPGNDPQGPAEGEFHVWRGGSWRTGEAGVLETAVVLRTSMRFQDNIPLNGDRFGFRCAKSAP